LRAALVLLLIPHVLIGLLLLYFALMPTLSFWALMGPALGGLAILLAVYSIAMRKSWRESRIRRAAGPWWSRWYGILAFALLNFGANWLETDLVSSFYRAFYVPAESMLPTLRVNDGFLASMRTPDPLRRGDVVLVEADRGTIYVSRLAALPGDRIALVDGVVFLNGQPVGQRLVGTEQLPREAHRAGTGEARRLAEQFPGEASAHEIYDTGRSEGDDYPERRIPPGHVFVLGDNRDDAADSRISRERMGLELVPIERVRGRALYHSWRSSRPMGTPIGGR
jgi:signal peptidase I